MASPMILTPGDSTMKAYKVLVMGDGSSGKTSIINRYAQESFGAAYRQTIGLDWYTKRLDLPGGVTVTLQIWDIGGQQLGGKMIQNYLEGCDAVMLVYDLTNAASFENIEDWMDLVSTQFADSATKPHIALVGNKRDVSHLRVVSLPKHESFVKAHGLSSHFVSAKTGDQVSLTFRKVVGFLTGIPVSKAEAEQLGRVLTAEVVVHPDAEPQRVPMGISRKGRRKGTSKSSTCSVQ